MKRKKAVRIERVTIQLLPGFVIDEQIIVRNTDLSWITLTSDDELITSTFSPTTILGVNFGYGSGQNGVFAVANGKLPLFYKFNYQPDVSGWGIYSAVFVVTGGGELNITDSNIVSTGIGSGSRLMFISVGTARVLNTNHRASSAGVSSVNLSSGSDLIARNSNFRVVGSDEDASNDITVSATGTLSGNFARLINCRGGTSIAPNTFVNGSLVLSN